MSIFWLVAFIAFAVGEALTIGLVSIWFAIGALGGLACAALGGGCGSRSPFLWDSPPWPWPCLSP